MPIYAGVSGANRQVMKVPVGVSGANRECKSAWAGAGGANRQIFMAGTPLSSKAVGSIIKIKENSTLIDFYVACHNYEKSLNGAGRTLVVRKDVYDQRKWHSSGVNAWASCSILSWLNSGYKAMFDTGIQQLIGATTYYYTPGNGNWSVTTRSDAVFLLSLAELGQSHASTNVEGSTLPIASTLQIAYQNGAPAFQWTRSPNTGYTSGAWSLSSRGTAANFGCTNTLGSRPVFTLPSSILLNDNNEITA